MSSPRKGMPPLERRALSEDAIEQFAEWYEIAESATSLPEAMTLATVDGEGRPNARMVLLKGFGRDGFRFFTNYESVKGAELKANPVAALVLYWREIDRQVRIRGGVERLPAEDSDAYFASRPRDSRLAASVSPQSRPIEREELDLRYARAEGESKGGEIERPDHWGGFRLIPDQVEFWQGRESRMHDRFLYTREGTGWRIERLAP